MIRQFIQDLGKYLPAQIVPAIVGFVSIPIITHIFPPGDYGNYILALSTATIFSTLAGWLAISIIRFHPVYERDGKLDEFYGLIIKLSIATISGIALIYIICLHFLHDYIQGNLYSLLLIGAILFVIMSAFNVLLHILRAKFFINLYSGFSVLKSIGGIALGLALIIILQFGIGGLLWGSVLCMAIALPFLWKVAIKHISFRQRIFSSPTLEMAQYAVPLVIANLAAWILSFSDRYILEFYRGSLEVGIYSASYQISEYGILFIATLFMLSAGPIGINIFERDGTEKSREFVSKTTRYYIMICLPAAVGLSVLAEPIISVLTGPEYYEGFQIVSFVVFGGFLLGLQQRYQSGLIFYKKTRPIMICIIVAGLLNLVLNILFIPSFGYMAAAITTLIGYAVLLILMVIISQMVFKWKFPFISLVKISIASGIMAVLVYYLNGFLRLPEVLNLIFCLFIGIFTYFTLLMVLHEIKTEELSAIKCIMNRKDD